MCKVVELNIVKNGKVIGRELVDIENMESIRYVLNEYFGLTDDSEIEVELNEEIYIGLSEDEYMISG